MAQAGNRNTAECIQIPFTFTIPQIAAFTMAESDGQRLIGFDNMVGHWLLA
jgi:hypothetical protein